VEGTADLPDDPAWIHGIRVFHGQQGQPLFPALHSLGKIKADEDMPQFFSHSFPSIVNVILIFRQAETVAGIVKNRYALERILIDAG